MKTCGTNTQTRTLYAIGWRQTGPAVLVTLMLVMTASVAMLRAQTTANPSEFAAKNSLALERAFHELQSGKNQALSQSVQLELPLHHLRNADGRMTPNGESFFLLLARRVKSLSLSVMLTINSIDDAEFATAIAARMMLEVPLDAAQMRISASEHSPDATMPMDSRLTVTITRHETAAGDFE